MGKASLLLRVINSALAISGLYLILWYMPEPIAGVWLSTLFFAVLIFAMVSLKGLLPMEDIFSFEYVIIILYVLSHGFGALLSVALGISGYMAMKKKTAAEAVYFVCSTVVAVWGAAAIFEQTGGIFAQMDITRDYIPLLCFLSALLVFVFGFKAVYESLLKDRPLGFFHFLKDESTTTLLVVVNSIIATILYQGFGWIGMAMVLLLTAGIWKMIRVYFHSEQKYINTVGAFLSITENKIPHYSGHSERVARYCEMILDRLRVSREDKCLIEYTALLHDIGKVGMPENLLRMNRYFTSEEIQTLESHPEIGRRVVKQISGMDKAADLIYCHHERYDGKGYPRSLCGEEIPFGARVVAAANVFDNLLNRVGLRFEQACAKLKTMAGAELDPEVVDVLFQALLEADHDPAGIDNKQVAGCLETRTKDVVEQLRYYLDKSWVLGTLQISYIVLWQHGELKNLGQAAISDSIRGYLAEYAAKSREVGSCCKEFVIDSVSAKIFNAYFVQISEDSCLITIFDMTEVLKTERDREDREQQIYRDIISAVTQGKLVITFGDEIDNFLGDNGFQTELGLSDPADVACARAAVRDVIKDIPLAGQRKTKLILCVSEAATNVIKHVGEGRMSVQVLTDSIRVVIRDNGPGIDISQIPQVTLHKGYSTKISLGFGFTVMLDYLDRLLMSTKNGTILVLEMKFDGEKTADQLPDRNKVVGQYA